MEKAGAGMTNNKNEKVTAAPPPKKTQKHTERTRHMRKLK
jgi:hypothetical protein